MICYPPPPDLSFGGRHDRRINIRYIDDGKCGWRASRSAENLAVAGSDLEDLKILGRHLDRCFDTSDRTND